MHPFPYRVLLCSALAALLLSGCALALVGGGAAAAVGVIAYRNGDLSVMDDVAFPNAYTAVHKAVGDLEFTLVSEKRDALEGEVVARAADSTKVRIRLKRMNEKTTKLMIRFGTFGDESKSRQVLEKIRARYSS